VRRRRSQAGAARHKADTPPAGRLPRTSAHSHQYSASGVVLQPPRWKLRRRRGPPASHPQRRRVHRSSWEDEAVVDGDVVRGHGRRDPPVAISQSRCGAPKGPRPTARSDTPTSLSHLPASNVPRPAASTDKHDLARLRKPVSGERRRRALIHAVCATEGGSGATHHTPNARRMGVRKQSDSFRLLWVSIVIAGS